MIYQHVHKSSLDQQRYDKNNINISCIMFILDTSQDMTKQEYAVGKSGVTRGMLPVIIHRWGHPDNYPNGVPR